MDHFWKEISKKVGVVPDIIRIVLEQEKYIHGGLAFLDDNAISDIEADIRRFPETTGKTEKEWNKLLDYHGELKTFSFSAGERSILKMIGAAVKDHGISKFSRSMLRGQVTNEQATSSGASASSQASTLKNKIVDFFEKKYGAENMCWLKDLSSTDIILSKDSTGLKASVPCPFCAARVLIRPEATGTWKISNFSTHVRSKHFSAPCPKERPHKDTLKRPYPVENSENVMPNYQSFGSSSPQQTLQEDWLESSEVTQLDQPKQAILGSARVQQYDELKNEDQENEDLQLYNEIESPKGHTFLLQIEAQPQYADPLAYSINNQLN